MKKIYGYIGGILLTAAMVLGITACTPDDFPSLNEAGIPVASEYDDAIQIDVDQETNNVTFTFNGKGVMPIWIIDKVSFSTTSLTRYYRKAGEYSVDIKIANSNGLSDGAVNRKFEIEKTIMNGFEGFVYDSEYNMWLSATVNPPTFWYAPEWNQISDPAYTLSNGAYVVTLPAATTDTWQAQMAMATNMGTEASKNYDFSLILTSTADHPHVMVKLVDSTSDNVFYVEQTIALTANEPVCFWKSDMPGIDIENLNLVLDFGGNAEGSVITIENIVLKDHANDDGTVVPEAEPEPEPTWSAVDSEDNLWNGMDFTNTFYYAPGWNQIANPVLTVAGPEYSVSFPESTDARWQNQVTFVTENLTMSADRSYDFRVSFTSSNDINDATIKLCQNDNDDNYIFEMQQSLTGGEEVIVKSINTAGKDITQAKLVLDFGGNPANTNVVIKDIILQEHKD